MLYNPVNPKRKSLFCFEYPVLLLEAQARGDLDDDAARQDLAARVGEMQARVKTVLETFPGLNARGLRHGGSELEVRAFEEAAAVATAAAAAAAPTSSVHASFSSADAMVRQHEPKLDSNVIYL